MIVAAVEAVGGSGGAGPSSSGALPVAGTGKAKKPTKAQQAAFAAAAAAAAPAAAVSNSNPLVRTLTPPLQTLHRDHNGSLACFPTPGPPDSSPGGADRAAQQQQQLRQQHRHLEIGDDEELIGPEGMDFDPFGSEDDDDDVTQGGNGGGGSQVTGGNGDCINPQTGKRQRRRVTVATTDADGRPYTQVRRVPFTFNLRRAAPRSSLLRSCSPCSLVISSSLSF